MKIPRVLAQPVGLVLLAVTLVFAVATLFDAAWSGREAWLVLWGLLAYAATVGTSLISRRRDPASASNVAPAEPASSSPGAAPAEPPPPDFEQWTADAVRHLRDPAALSVCKLMTALPYSLAAAGTDTDHAATATPLEHARRLRSILDAAIERLRLAAGTTSSQDTEALQYVILHEEYVLGRPNTYIMTHHSISETTFHRYRRLAIHALASELAAQEHLLATAAPRSR